MTNPILPDTTTTAFLGQIERRHRSDSNAYLLVIQGARIGRRIALTEQQPIMLGRAEDADAQVNEVSVSRTHAIIRKQEEGFLIEDQNSKNGTFVNGERCKSRELKDQDLIAIGGTIFKFLANDSLELDYHEELHRLASLDPMLQIFNRRVFVERLEERLKRSLVSQMLFSVLLFDIDHFKRINDTYGHQAGDVVLQRVADVVGLKLRGSDLLSRYGGEEFAAILPNTDLEEARMVAEKLRQTVESLSLELEETPVRITISLGVAAFDPAEEPSPSSHDLISRADSALYRAKQGGRNRTVAHGDVA